MNIVIIDYGAGNTKSVEFAFDRIGRSAVLSKDPEVIEAADAVIFPGVGHAAHAMEQLKKDGLDQLIPQLKQPVLGVCLGMQLLLDETEEGNVSCLGIIPGSVKAFKQAPKIPHMGWNQLLNNTAPLFEGVEDGAFVYFVHSYFVPEHPQAISVCEYGERFTAAIQKDNFFGCQFHPEKSGKNGERVLLNFLKICESYQQ